MACLGELSVARGLLFWGNEMTRNAKFMLYQRTLWAGIIVGVVGLLIMLFSNMFMQTIGTYTFNGSNGFFFALTHVYVVSGHEKLPVDGHGIAR